LGPFDFGSEGSLGFLYIAILRIECYRKVKQMRGKNRRPFPQRPNRGGHGKRESMLDMGRVTTFLYYAEEIARELKIEENVWNPIISTVVAKASRMGIEEAAAFLGEKVKSGELPKESEGPLKQLLERYSRMR